MTDPSRPRERQRSDGPAVRPPSHRAPPGRPRGESLFNDAPEPPRRRGSATVLGIAVLLVGIGALGALGLRSPEPEPLAQRPAPAPVPATSPAPPAMPDRSGGEFSAETAPATPVLALEANPLNEVETGAAPVPCTLPEFESTPEGQRAFFEAAMPCLDGAWRPVLEAANLPFRSADVELVTREVQTPCGSRSPTQTALYCDGTIYMTSAYYRDVEGHGDTAGVYFGQLAHEYGHHVQELAGIMDASWRERHGQGVNTPGGFEVARRFELQATCFGGMFLSSVARGSVDPGTVDEALTDSGRRGDYTDGRPPDHGRPEINAAWVQRGFDENSTSRCDTWSVAPDIVR